MSKYKVGFLVNSNANAFCKNTEVVDLIEMKVYIVQDLEQLMILKNL